jgi:hypothetical protein
VRVNIEINYLRCDCWHDGLDFAEYTLTLLAIIVCLSSETSCVMLRMEHKSPFVILGINYASHFPLRICLASRSEFCVSYLSELAPESSRLVLTGICARLGFVILSCHSPVARLSATLAAVT